MSADPTFEEIPGPIPDDLARLLHADAWSQRTAMLAATEQYALDAERHSRIGDTETADLLSAAYWSERDNRQPPAETMP